MGKTRKEVQQIPVKNPFEKVTAEQLNSDLIAYLFAKPEEAIYSKLINTENYRIIGGWGSGKTTLLKSISFETQIERLKGKIKRENYVGIYIKTGQSGFKPFLKIGGEFKKGGEILFGHYFNLLICERIISVILYGKEKGFLKILPREESNLVNRIWLKFSIIDKKTQMGYNSSLITEVTDLQSLKNKLESWRLEIETFLNTRDLEDDLSYKAMLSVYPTSIKTFLNDVIQDIKNIIKELSQKRFYILLDECDLLSIGQQKVINTIIKQRFSTIVFKLASRPPNLKTMETIDEGVGLTDREIKKINLDEMYDPTSISYKDLCYRVAKKRLEMYEYSITDINKILGKYTIEDEIGRDNIEQYLKENYPNKKRIETDFNDVYKDFKVAAAFQILRSKKLRKKYAGFDDFVILSSGIMLHFLELCGNAFIYADSKKYKDGRNFKQIPLPVKIQDMAVQKVSEEFYREVIKTRAESLKDTSSDMEFGSKIQYIVSVLTGIFREKLMTFNDPEATRIEIPEGISSLDNSGENPIQQLFETAIKISVFQEEKPYMPKKLGGIRPPTYILNRILAPYPEMISPRPRMRTTIPSATFNNILKISAEEFKNEVLGKKMKKKAEKEEKEVEEEKKELPKGQLTLPLIVSESMPVLAYLSKKIKNKPFYGKNLIILLHFLRDLIPFMDSLKKAGALPSSTILFYKDYQYPNKDIIKRYLKGEGYNIYPLTEIDNVLQKLEPKSFKDIIVIEDGGHIVPRLHKSFKNLSKVTLGAVEQTTRGIRNDVEAGELLFPVISIPGSTLKNTFEPPNVARAVINNIQKLIPNKTLSGKKTLVIGYGSIGKEIALQLRDTLRMQVSIFDLDNSKLLEAQQSGFDTVENLRAGVKEKFLIIGATGETSIGRSEVLAMEHNVHLISASSEQWEFCISELDSLSSNHEDINDNNGEKLGTKYILRNNEKYVNLIADGYPINFWKMESMPNEVSDLIMSLIFISAVEMATNRSLPRQINHDITNELAVKNELSQIYLEFHK